MRNLGLALVLIGSITAPHAAWAKKPPSGKRGRSAKGHEHEGRKQETHQAITPAHHDQLASALPQAAPPSAAPRHEAAPPAAEQPNAPLNMANQSSDDELPGARKKR